MKKQMTFAFLICLAAGSAYADVSDEILAGWSETSLKEYKSEFNGTDMPVDYESKSSSFSLSYTHLLEPLKDDETPIDLRRFLQHPSAISIGLFQSESSYNYTLQSPPMTEEAKTNAVTLSLSGELYFLSHTGLLLSGEGGSDTAKWTINGIASPDEKYDFRSSSIGVRQYVAPNVALHLVYDDSKTDAKTIGATTTNRQVTSLGVLGVVDNMLALELELGRGTLQYKTTETDNYDVAQINAMIGIFIGKQLSFTLGISRETDEQTGLPAGFKSKTTMNSTTLAGSYWFSEGFGLELPINLFTAEARYVYPVGEGKTTSSYRGAGLYATFRF